jgi:signal transduction histidine kinase
VNPATKQNRIEWAFLASMIALCAILTALQYRWTGELARAEMTRLRANLSAPAEQMVRAFDAELGASCAQLLPTAAEVDASGREAAHADRVRQWQAGNPRPLFRRVALAVRDGTGLQLRALDPRTLKFSPLTWPDGWAALRENLQRRIATPGGPRFVSRDGTLLDFAVFGGRRALAGPNVGWLILELDTDYVRDTWLPELDRTFLNSDGQAPSELRVRTEASPSTVLYANTGQPTERSEPQIAVPFNRLGRRADEERGRWILELRQQPGALESMVAATRRRNLAVALLLNGLMLTAGVLLLRHTRRSRQLAEAQMLFVANVSHELRTPLTVIRGAAHNLKRGVVQAPERIAEYAALILQHVEGLTGMVEQVLEFAAARKNSPSSPRQPLSLSDVLKDAIAAAEPDAHAAKCAVELALPADLPPVRGDERALRRVFQNLVSNAAKHGGKGGWIGVTATVTNGSTPPAVEVQVADRGPGIPESEQAGIFLPFVRGAAAHAAQVRGSGLGLSLVREIVEAHGGTVTVQSAGGRCATFTVRLPVEPSPK